MRRALALLCLLGCGGGQAFTLSAADNDPAALRRALAADPPAPARRAVAYLALEGGKLAALDVAEAKTLWSVEATPTSRVVVCGSFLAAREGDELVGRDAADGRRLWAFRVAALVGLAGDADRVVAVEQTGAEWTAVALDRAGAELWRTASPSRLGAPAVRGGRVYLPFLEQWLNILDARTGVVLARLRQEDEAVSWVRAAPEGVTYGARSVIALDAGAASGKRDPGRFLPISPRVYARWPGLLASPDAYAPFGGYGARDRTRLLWRTVGGEPLAFRDGLVTLLVQRVFFGIDPATGRVVTAYDHPRNDVVGAEDMGGKIVFVTGGGELGVLARTGGLQSLRPIGAHVLGATLDGDYAGEGTAAAPPVDDVLAEIALDRDARLTTVKQFAVDALPRRPGPAAVAALLRVLADEQAAGQVTRSAEEALLAGRDPEGAALIVAALGRHTDAVSGTVARRVDVLARALAARGGAPGAVPALVAHLEDPATPDAVRRDVAAALAALGGPDAAPALASFLLLHRCDPRWEAAQTAVVDALLVLGEREVLRFVAGDPATAPALAAQIEEKLR